MEKIKRTLSYLKNRFGIPEEVFDDYMLIEQKDVWVASKEAAGFPIRAFSRRGIRLARIFPRGVKFTTAGMQVFGKYATRNIVRLRNEDELERYLRGEDINVGDLEGVQEGQVIVKWNDDILGSAVYRDGKLKNQLPKGRRIIGARKKARK